MQVLFLVRPDFSYKKNITGDVIQILETKKALENIGVDVTISTGFKIKGNWDVIHLWNSSDWYVGYTYLRILIIGKKYPTVLSTIYWPWQLKSGVSNNKGVKALYLINKIAGTYAAGLADSLYSKMKSTDKIPVVARTKKYYNDRKLGTDEIRRRAYQLAGALLPNSKSEKQIIIDRYGFENKIYVVPNAVDYDLFANAKPDWFIGKYGIKSIILCVGVISPWKNQLAVLNALRDSDETVVLIGNGAEDYMDKCRGVKRKGKTIILPVMNREEVASAFKAAKVHVLASYRETPGLVSLEAAAAGCAIVSTDRGSARDYFGDEAFYCDPDNEESIKCAVNKAIETGPSRTLNERVRENFSWGNAAKETLRAYKQVFGYE